MSINRNILTDFDRSIRVRCLYFCVCQRTQSLCAWPFRKPRPSTFSSLVLRFRHPFSSRCRLAWPAAQPRRTSTPNLPTIEFA